MELAEQREDRRKKDGLREKGEQAVQKQVELAGERAGSKNKGKKPECGRMS